MSDSEKDALVQEVARLHDQVAHLNQENLALQAENVRLKEDIHSQRGENSVEGLHRYLSREGQMREEDVEMFVKQDESELDDEGSVQGSSKERGTTIAGYTPKLPAEIWNSIFQRAIPPSWLLDPALSLGPDSSWSVALRLKKCIVAVCRTWNSIGLPFLYEDVYIRRVHQFASLLETIQKRPGELGQLVKTLNILCYVPRVLAGTFTRYLEVFFPLFPRLSAFAYTSPVALPLQASIPNLPQSITRLDLTGLTSWNSAVGLLMVAGGTLTSLRLRLPLSLPSSVPKGGLELPSLTSIYLADDNSTDDLRAFTRIFGLPNLSRCTLIDTAFRPREEASANPFVEFLTRHGANLRYLNLRLLPVTFLPSLQRICPRLEHFITPVSATLKPLEEFMHRSLKWMDFNCSSVAPTLIPNSIIISLRCHNLPALQGCRLLSNLPNVTAEWVEKFPPGAVKDRQDAFTIDFSPSQLQHGVDYVYWQRQGWSPGWDHPDGLQPTFRDIGWPNVESTRLEDSFKFVLKRPEKEYKQSDFPAYFLGMELYDEEEDSSEDELASDGESEESITNRDDAEMDLAPELLGIAKTS
ncbi:hypothetical protein NLJ89_g1907 [Agrocybe chaxingu]|uniref:F-box domain-containing protein n=1 Tax=Agrocybe chaxingu TaxID=84603 RepID=A0A9W8TCM4_9AGAR|nr:hypothetical protein NLJ89_g1907 [Agrocybe chaxingu]